MVVEGHIMEGLGRSWKVLEGHGRSFPDTRLTFHVRKDRDLGLGLGLDNNA